MRNLHEIVDVEDQAGATQRRHFTAEYVTPSQMLMEEELLQKVSWY